MPRLTKTGFLFLTTKNQLNCVPERIALISPTESYFPFLRYPPGIGGMVSTRTPIHHREALQPLLDDVGFELLRRCERPTVVVHETIREQVHW
jgi:hypothetical protein